MGVLSWSAVLAISIVGRLPVLSTAAFAAAATLCIGLSSIGSPFTITGLGFNAIAHTREIAEFAVVFVGAPVGAVVDSLHALEPGDQYAVSLAAGSVGMRGVLYRFC
ncbi:MAG: hypothetical protein IID39_03955 [Planctomycetes bacterium]|nr:hypothetical protein [Planctomycetota bacterium]